MLFHPIAIGMVSTVAVAWAAMAVDQFRITRRK
jgi:hypothetical protein